MCSNVSQRSLLGPSHLQSHTATLSPTNILCFPLYHCLVLLQYKLYKGKAYWVCSLLHSWSLEEYLEHSRHSINTTLNEHMNEVVRQTRPETASLRSKDSFSLVRQGRWYYWQRSGTLDRWNKFFYGRCQVRFWTQKHLKYTWINQVVIYYKQLENWWFKRSHLVNHLTLSLFPNL